MLRVFLLDAICPGVGDEHFLFMFSVSLFKLVLLLTVFHGISVFVLFSILPSMTPEGSGSTFVGVNVAERCLTSLFDFLTFSLFFSFFFLCVYLFFFLKHWWLFFLFTFH